MIGAAAKALANEVSESDLKQGRIYPPLDSIREVSASIAAAVINVAYDRDLAMKPMPEDLLSHIKSMMYVPEYQSYV